MKTITAKAAFRQVTRAAETIRNAEPAAVPVMDPGDTVRQGDVYLTLLDREPKTLGPAPSRQLAPGTTRGSRHVAEGPCEVLADDERESVAALNRLVPATRGRTLFVGPVVRAPEGFTVTHPEHGHRTLPPGSYQVTYQASWSAMERAARRTLD